VTCEWEYIGTGYYGSSKGDDAYECKRCKLIQGVNGDAEPKDRECKPNRRAVMKLLANVSFDLSRRSYSEAVVLLYIFNGEWREAYKALGELLKQHDYPSEEPKQEGGG